MLAALGSRIASDPGDPVLNAAILAWDATRFPWSNTWFQFPIFWPTQDALTFSEHLLGVGVLAAPIYWLTDNALVAYNLAVLVSYPLAACAMYALVWRSTRNPAAAFLSGLAYGFAPYRASHLPHIQVLTSFWAPLALLALHEFITAGRRWWLLVFAICWLLQGASNGYFLVYFSLLVGLWILWFLVARGRWRDAVLVVGSMAVAALPLAPILYRYLTAQRELGLSRNLGEIASFGADIAAPFCAPTVLTVWGWLRIGCAPEGELFPGLALVTACVIGAIAARARRTAPAGAAGGMFVDRRWVRTLRRAALAVAVIYAGIALSVLVAGPWRVDLGAIRGSASSVDKPLSTALAALLLATLLSRAFARTLRAGSTGTFYVLAALVCWVLAWGPFPRLFGTPVLYQAPFAWLLQLPGVDGLRVPARFWMMSVLCLSVFMGLVMAQLLSSRRRAQAPIVLLLAVGLIADGFATVPAAATAAVGPRAASLAGRTILALPLGDLERDVAAVYEAVDGQWQSVNGFSGYEPNYYEALRTLSQERNPALFLPFRARTDLLVVVSGSDERTRQFVEEQHGVELLETRAGRRVYRLPRAATDRVRPETGKRLAASAVAATCSSESVAFATDGDLETHWVCGPQSDDHAITLDLGTVAAPAAVVHALGIRGAAFPRHLVIETSLDLQQWERAWEGSPAAAVFVAAFDAPRESRAVIPFEPRPARYVRLRQTGRHQNFWSAAELEVRSGSSRP